MSQELFKAEATGIAEKLHEGDGPLKAIPILPLISIIMEMIQQIMACFQPASPAGQSVQEYVAANYKDGKYPERLIRRMQIQALIAGRHVKPHQKLNDEQTRALAIAALDKARLGSDETKAAIDHAASLPV